MVCEAAKRDATGSLVETWAAMKRSLEQSRRLKAAAACSWTAQDVNGNDLDGLIWWKPSGLLINPRSLDSSESTAWFKWLFKQFALNSRPLALIFVLPHLLYFLSLTA